MSDSKKPGLPEGIRWMTPMSRTMYDFACHMAHQATVNPYKPVTAYPMAAVVHATGSLEAFLNEEVERWRALATQWDEKTIAAIDRVDFAEKWRLVAQLLLGQTFERDGEPFQSLQALVKLRNALVHYRSKFRTDEEEISVMGALRSRFRFTQIEPPPGFPELVLAHWTDRVLNPACGRWACETASRVALEWRRLWRNPEAVKLAEWEWSLAPLDGKRRCEAPGSTIEPGPPPRDNEDG